MIKYIETNQHKYAYLVSNKEYPTAILYIKQPLQNTTTHIHIQHAKMHFKSTSHHKQLSINNILSLIEGSINQLTDINKCPEIAVFDTTLSDIFIKWNSTTNS